MTEDTRFMRSVEGLVDADGEIYSLFLDWRWLKYAEASVVDGVEVISSDRFAAALQLYKRE